MGEPTGEGPPPAGEFTTASGDTLTSDGAGNVDFVGTDGSTASVGADGSASYQGADGASGQQNPDGTGEWTSSDGTVTTFNADGSGSSTAPDGSETTFSSEEGPPGDVGSEMADALGPVADASTEAFGSPPPGFEQFAAEGPPAEGPPAEGPPAEGPPAEGPPAEGPPAEGPPAEGPPSFDLGDAIESGDKEEDSGEKPPEDAVADGVDGSLVEHTETPPAEGPPAEGPPAEGPPADDVDDDVPPPDYDLD